MSAAEQSTKVDEHNSCDGPVCYACVWNRHNDSSGIVGWPERYPLAFVVGLSVISGLIIAYLPPVVGIELPALSLMGWSARVVLAIILLALVFRFLDWKSADTDPQSVGIRQAQRRPITKLFIIIFVVFPVFSAAIFFVARIIPQWILPLFGIDSPTVDLIENIISLLLGIIVIAGVVVFWFRVIDYLMEWQPLTRVVDRIGSAFPWLRFA